MTSASVLIDLDDLFDRPADIVREKAANFRHAFRLKDLWPVVMFGFQDIHEPKP